MSKEYKVHPAATLFPLMTSEEYQGIKQDIAENGQREPIILWCDQILDGRNRLKACEELGIKPVFFKLDKDTDPWKYVISHNLHRRHLNTSQRAAIAAKMATLKNGEQKRHATQNCGASIDEAAKSLNVSPRSVTSAKKVQKSGSKAVQRAVESGKLPVGLAADLVKSVPSKSKQTVAVAEGTKAIREAVKKPAKGKEVVSAAKLFTMMQGKHFSGKTGLPQTIDAMAEANGGKGPQYEIASASLDSFLAAVKLMRDGKR